MLGGTAQERHHGEAGARHDTRAALARQASAWKPRQGEHVWATVRTGCRRRSARSEEQTCSRCLRCSAQALRGRRRPFERSSTPRPPPCRRGHHAGPSSSSLAAPAPSSSSTVTSGTIFRFRLPLGGG
jgi:hypothetical protein